MKAFIGDDEYIHVEAENVTEALAMRYVVDRMNKENDRNNESGKEYLYKSPVCIRMIAPEEDED